MTSSMQDCPSLTYYLGLGEAMLNLVVAMTTNTDVIVEESSRELEQTTANAKRC
jgi:hypothetical protein